jgi:acetoacetate decarboxylase
VSAESVVENTFSMPRAAPLYEAPPYLYQGNRSIIISFRTTAETLQGLVPTPLVPNPQSRVFIYISECNVIAPQLLCYREAGIGVPVSFSDTAGQYAVYLYLDNVTAIALGREIYGWPKKDAEISVLSLNGLDELSQGREQALQF